MKIIFQESELDSLPQDARDKLDDDLSVEVESLSDLSDEFESVSGLKNALKSERESARESKAELKAIGKAGGSKAYIKEMQTKLEKLEAFQEIATHHPDLTIEKIDAMLDGSATLDTLTKENEQLKADNAEKDQDAKIIAATTKHRGDFTLLKPQIVAHLTEHPDADLDEFMPTLKDRHPGAFGASQHSGGGTSPAKGRDASLSRPRHDAMPTRRSEMTDRQKVDYQNKHGLDALMDLPD